MINVSINISFGRLIGFFFKGRLMETVTTKVVSLAGKLKTN